MNKSVIAVASDHGGYALKETVKEHLRRQGWQIDDFGCDSEESADWPEYIYPAASAVAQGEAGIGILIDGAGFSAGMLANRFPALRAAVCWDVFTAQVARQHVDANVLCIGGKVLNHDIALNIVDTFLSTEFTPDLKYQRRIAQLDRYSGYMRGRRASSNTAPQKNWITAEDVIRFASVGKIYEPGPGEELTPEARDLLTRLRANFDSIKKTDGS